MKKWIFSVLAVVLVWGVPFTRYDAEKLLPIRCIQAQRENGGVRILSEAGEGYGSHWIAAVEDLRDNALGEVFFQTAEQAVFSDMALAVEAAESGILRPGAQVFFRKTWEDPEILYEYYSQHRSNLKISDLMGRSGGA